MSCEITITIKGESDKYAQKFLCYDPIIDQDLLNHYVHEAKANYRGQPDEIVFKITGGV